LNMKHLIKIALCICGALAFTSCDKVEGCMDENALNYDITAEVNRGCIYCGSSDVEDLNTFSDYMIDNRFNSELFQDSVLVIRVEHRLQDFEFTQCGVSGCTFRIYATNITEYSMSSFQFNFEVPFQTTFGGYFFQINGNSSLSLSPGEEKDITNLFNAQNPQNCTEMADSGFNFTSIFSGFYTQ